MDVIVLSWWLSILSLLLFFGILTGLTLNLFNLSKKLTLIVSLSYGLILIIFSEIVGFFSPLGSFSMTYASTILLIVSIIVLIISLSLIYKHKFIKINKRMKILSIFAILFLSVTLILLDTLFFSDILGFNLYSISFFEGIFLTIIIFTTCFLFKVINKFSIGIIFLSKVLLFLGSFFALFSLILPNMINGFNNQMGKISIDSIEFVGLFCILFFILLVIGLFVNKRKSFLLN